VVRAMGTLERALLYSMVGHTLIKEVEGARQWGNDV